MTSKEKIVYRKSVKFQNLRTSKIAEANNRCQLCQVRKNKGLNIHHIDESKYNQPDEADYTVVLCPVCHKFIETKLKVLNNTKNPDNVHTIKLRQLIQPFTNVKLVEIHI